LGVRRGLVQYNNARNAVTIATRCSEMTDTKLGTPLQRLLKITKERLGGQCLSDPDCSGVTDTISFAAHLKGYASPANAARSFPYQQCVDGCGHQQTCYADKVRTGGTSASR
jgi:hypothetical protein